MAVTLGYFAETAPGIEPISWLEIRKQFPQAQFGQNLFVKGKLGIPTFTLEGDVPDVTELRTVRAVYLRLIELPKLARTRRDLQTITQAIRASEAVGQAANALMRWRRFSSAPDYTLSVRKVGQHGYRVKDLERAVRKGLVARLPRWEPVATAGQVQLVADLIGNHLLVGCRLTAAADHIPFSLPKSISDAHAPPTAAAMITLTQPEPDDVFLDPMCDRGLLLLTRRHMGAYGRLLGGDLDIERVTAARQNVITRRRGYRTRPIDIRRWDARSLPLEPDSVTKIATYLPSGKQDKGLIAGILAELERVVAPGGRIVVFTHAYDETKALLRERPSLELQTGYSVMAHGRWGRIYIITRSA